MKKVKVYWTEFHNYCAEIEIPDSVSEKGELDWIMNNTHSRDMCGLTPYQINTDWDTFWYHLCDESNL